MAARVPSLPPIPWQHVPITPLPEVIESNTDSAWARFDAAQQEQDRAPAAPPAIQPTEGST